MTSAKKRRFLRIREPNGDWLAVPFGAVFAAIGALGLAGRLENIDLDGKTPCIRKTPEGLPVDDPAAWFGPPQLDVSDPAQMRDAAFDFRIPDLREFSRREGFNPLGGNVEWRLEILLFRSGHVRRESFRVQIARSERPSRTSSAPG